MFSVQQNIFDTGASNDCKMSFYTFKLCFIMFTVSSGKTAMFSFITASSRVRDTCHVSSSHEANKLANPRSNQKRFNTFNSVLCTNV